MGVQDQSGGSHVVDPYFRVQGKEITVDHGYALYGAISRCLESEHDRWLHGSEEVGLIPVRGRYLGQGRLALDRNDRPRPGSRDSTKRRPVGAGESGSMTIGNGDRHRGTTVDMFVYEPFEFDTEYAAAMQGELLPGLYTRFVSIPALIRMKEAANRPRDLDDIQHLRWILEDQNG